MNILNKIHTYKRHLKLCSLILPLLAISVQELAAQNYKVLVFTRATGFVHDSIPDGLAAIEKLGTENNFQVDSTDDPSAFTEANLAQYAAVIFLHTSESLTDPLMNASQKGAFESYIKGGGGFVGIHGACDVSGTWPWYDGLIGANFLDHPPQAPADLYKAPEYPGIVTPLFDNLDANYIAFFDEWYNFEENPLEIEGLTPLLFVDENSYPHVSKNGTSFEQSRHDFRFGAEHPISWYQGYGPYWFRDYGKGRSWYTGIGQRRQLFFQKKYAWYREHMLRGIEYAAGLYTEPYTTIPGTIEVEDYDAGLNLGNTGFRVSYSDTSPGNTGQVYRTDDVDLRNVSGDNYATGWVVQGEWLEYTVEVTESGSYSGVARVASAEATDKSFSIWGVDPNDLDSLIDLTGPITFNTGGAGWNVWFDVNIPSIQLEAGVQTLRVIMETSSFDTDFIQLSAAATEVEIQFDDFESNFGNWIDGGKDCRRRKSGNYINGSKGVINLQDDTSSSVVTTDDLALSSYSEITVEFDYQVINFDAGESFLLEISTNGGQDYSTVATYTLDQEFSNDLVYIGNAVTFSGFTFTDQTRVRFRCNASRNSDDVYLDNIRITGLLSN